jgi:hypothetical protein
VTEYGHALRAIAFFNQRQFLIFFFSRLVSPVLFYKNAVSLDGKKKRRKIPEPGGG